LNLNALYIRSVVLLVRNAAKRRATLTLGRTLTPCCFGRGLREINRRITGKYSGKTLRIPEASIDHLRRYVELLFRHPTKKVSRKT
jgi:hypothetical protein